MPAIEKLKNISGNFTVEVFIGTWCSDSRREVPAFLKILKTGDLHKKMNVQMWAVDRSKNLDNGLARKRNIQRVPTFVFYSENTEIGRIIEYPENLLEQDIFNILNIKQDAK
jgi:hypothetical protein